MRGKPTILTAEQSQYLIDKYHNTLNKDLAKYLNVSIRTINRIAVSLNLVKDKEFCRSISQSHCRKMHKINALHNYKSQRESMLRTKALGKWGKLFEKGHDHFHSLPIERQKEINEKRAKKWKETFTKEKIRANWGFPTQTKFRLFSHRSKNIARHNLKKHGYACEYMGNEFTISSSTNRNLKLEEKYTIKFKFRFKVA